MYKNFYTNQQIFNQLTDHYFKADFASTQYEG